ncbi:MAG: hypothetical protein O7B26_05140 [Planctomycetota bacterium]|nr:hypothetical protein [Planctomycetota bacterium]
MDATSNNNRAGKRARFRRSYVVNAAFQWKYTLSIVFGVFIASSLLSSVLFGVLHSRARATILHQTNPSAVASVSSAPIVLATSLGFAALLGAGLGLWAMIVTHRIYGPIFVIEGLLGVLARGRFPKRRPLRRKDEFKGFYDAFWRSVESMKALKRSELKKLTESLALAKSALDSEGSGGRDMLESLVTRLESMRAECAESVDVESSEACAQTDRPIVNACDDSDARSIESIAKQVDSMRDECDRAVGDPTQCGRDESADSCAVDPSPNCDNSKSES